MALPTFLVLEPEAGKQWELNKRIFKPEAISELPDRCYAFLDARDYEPTDGRRELILAHFGAPKFVANRTCFESNGFFGHKATHGEQGDRKCVSSCTTWFRCLCKMVRKIDSEPHENGPEYARGTKDYQWYETTVLSRWDAPDKCQVLCIDVPFDVPTQLQKALADRDMPLNFGDPFAMHADLWDRLIVCSDISVWRVRDPVRRLEKLRLRPGEMFVPTHEFSRHALHVSEVLEASVETISAMDRCRAEIHRCVPDLSDTYKIQAAEYARFQVSLLRNLKLRSDSNRARLATEITFAFNSLSRQDNHRINSISLLTMVFLPAMFVSTVFSTSFFDLGDHGWQVSGKIWILWVTIVPATIIVMFVWQVWFAKNQRILGLLHKFPGEWVQKGLRGLREKDLATNKTKVGEP